MRGRTKRGEVTFEGEIALQALDAVRVIENFAHTASKRGDLAGARSALEVVLAVERFVTYLRSPEHLVAS